VTLFLCVWTANSTLAAVSGGECLGDALIAAVGSRDIMDARLFKVSAQVDF
jgi:hypothetical protein